ncbi:MAG TPA: hypothetical protein VHE30_10615 [Polyangiaceae bacterium]|nr:hypothetical protein [Polyangiaceae bacterium]
MDAPPLPPDRIRQPWRVRLGRLVAALDSPRIPLVAAVLGVLLSSPSLFAGLATEDFAQRDVVTHASSAFGPNLDLFGHEATWTLGDTLRRNQEYVLKGYFPWVSDPAFDASFFRPLTSLTHRLDYRLYPGVPALAHLQSLLWYGGLVAAVALLYRALAEPPLVGGLAALLYAVDDAHGQPIGWLINRNALLASLFAVLALSAYDRFRRGGGRLHAALAVVALALGFGSAEFALAGLGYFVAYALFVDEAPWRSRLAASLLFVVPTVVFLAARNHLGHRTVGSGLYLDPVGEPAAYLSELGERSVVLLLGLFGTPFSDVWSVSPPYERGLLVFFATAFVALLSWALLPGLLRDRRNRFWLGGLVLSLPPAAATFPEDRLLVLAGVGAFPLVARVVVEAVMTAGATSPSQRLRRGIAGFFVVVHAVLAPVLLPFRTFRMHRFQARLDDAAASVRGALRGTPGEAIVFVNAPTFYFAGILAATARLQSGKELPRVFTLAGTTDRLELTRTSEQSLDVRPKDGFFSVPFDRIHRGPRLRFRRGEELDFKGVAVTITEVDADGDPVAARFSFALPLESERYRFLAFRGGRYVPFAVPAVGGRASLGGV